MRHIRLVLLVVLIFCAGFSPADFDEDGDVDFYDFTVFSDQWLLKDADANEGPQWVLLPEMHRKFMEPAVVYDDVLWARHNIDTAGMLYFDGLEVKAGGKLPDGLNQTNHLYPLNNGEHIGMIVACSTLAGELKLNYSPSPKTTDFHDITPANLDGCPIPLHRSLVDCGQIAGKGRVLLWFEYVNSSPNVWYTTDTGADLADGNSWTQLFDSDVQTIQHFHGGIFVPDVGDNEGRLYVFTGDYNEESSILICDDVNDLIDNHEDWYDYWGFDANSRDSWSDTPSEGGLPDVNHVIGWNSQNYRTVDLCDDGDYAYWVRDCSHGGGNALFRLNHKTKAVEQVVPAYTGKIWGVGWMWKRTGQGDLLFTTFSSWADGGFVYGCDRYARLYMVNQGRDGVVELGKWPRSDYNPDTDPIRTPPSDQYVSLGFTQLTEYQGVVWLHGSGIEKYNDDLLGTSVRWREKLTVAGYVIPEDRTAPDKINLLLNPRFEDRTEGVLDDWVFVPSSGASAFVQEADPAIVEGGNSACAKISISADDSYVYVYQWLSPDITAEVAGEYITLAGKIRVASDASNDLEPMLQLRFILNDDDSTTIPYNQRFKLNYGGDNTALADDKWHEFWVTGFVPIDVRHSFGVRISLYGTANPNESGTVYFSDIRLVDGCLPGENGL